MKQNKIMNQKKRNMIYNSQEFNSAKNEILKEIIEALPKEKEILQIEEENYFDEYSGYNKALQEIKQVIKKVADNNKVGIIK